MRSVVLATFAVAFAASGALAAAPKTSTATTTQPATSTAPLAKCRDAKGHFIKCPAPAAPVAKPTCKDAKGHFAKCGSPGAKPT